MVTYGGSNSGGNDFRGAHGQARRRTDTLTRREILKNAGLAALGAAAALALANCGSTSPTVPASPAQTGPTGASVSSAEATTANSSVAARATVGKRVTLSVANYQWTQDGFREFYQQSSAAFASSVGNVEIEQIATAKGQFGDKMLTSVRAGDPPDLIMFDPILAQLIEGGELEPLDKWMDKTQIKQTWGPLQKTWPVSNGETYGLIVMATTWNEVYYNKRLFAEAGINDPPKTIDEFFDAAQKLTKGDQFGLGTSTKQSPEQQLFQDLSEYLFAFGGQWGANGKIDLTDPQVITSLKFYNKLYQAGVSPKNLDTSQWRQIFTDGKIGMIIDGPWQLVPTLKNPAMQQDLGVALMPTSATKRKSVAATNTQMIPKKAKNKELAWEYLAFIAQPEWQKKFFELTLSPPGMADVVPDGLFTKHPWLATFVESAKYAEASAPNGLYQYAPQIAMAVAEHAANVFVGGKSADAEMAAAQKDLQDILKV